MPNIKLKGQTGEVLTYEDVERVYFDDADQDGEVVYYTHGQAVSKTVTPNFASGDMNVPIADGELVTELTIEKPETLLPENIRSGVTVAGVKGDLIGDTEEVTVDLDMADGGQIITPSAATKVLSKVTVTKPGTMLPENIKAGIEIGGVVGEFLGDTEERTVELDFPVGSVETDVLPLTTYTGFEFSSAFGFYGVNFANTFALTIGETYMVYWDGETFKCVAQDGNSAIENYIALGNAVGMGLSGNDEPFLIGVDSTGSGVTLIAALTDTEDGGSHTVRIYQVTEGGTSDMVVTPTAEGKSMSQVTIKKPETLVPENIAVGVEIGGVVGNLSVEGTSKEIEPDFSAGDQTVTAGEDELWDEVIVKRPEALVPGNIVNGVDIAGVIGTFEAPKIVVKRILGSTATEGIVTLLTADELASIGFADASSKFALLIQEVSTTPTVSSWNKLAMNYIRYPYNVYRGTTSTPLYGYYSYHNRNGSYSHMVQPSLVSSNPWDGTALTNTMFYADGEIKFNMASTYARLSLSSTSASWYYVIAGCY